MRARFYDPDLGRFISPDPVGVLGRWTNLYTYTGNNPVSFSDPLGLIPQSIDQNGDLEDQDRYRGFFGERGDEYVTQYGPIDLRHYEAARQTAMRLSTLVGPGGALIATNGLGLLVEELQAVGPPEHPHNSANDPFDFLSNAIGSLAGSLGIDFYGDPRAAPPSPPGGGSGGNGGSGNAGSLDPNEKTGAAGFGAVGYIEPNSAIPYRIDFENDATATAPAQQVEITDQLSVNLDWSTFELTEIGFGDNLIAVPANSQYHQTSTAMTFNGRTFEVQIEVGIHSDTGQVFARFQSIDPLTSLPPDVLTGFLPPEDGTGRGMGHVSYVIKPKSDLPTGTEIRNIALITFDSGETIATNQVSPHDPSQGTDPTKEAQNTIDAGLPSSAVLGAAERGEHGAVLRPVVRSGRFWRLRHCQL